MILPITEFFQFYFVLILIYLYAIKSMCQVLFYKIKVVSKNRIQTRNDSLRNVFGSTYVYLTFKKNENLAVRTFTHLLISKKICTSTSISVL